MHIAMIVSGSDFLHKRTKIPPRGRESSVRLIQQAYHCLGSVYILFHDNDYRRGQILFKIRFDLLHNNVRSTKGMSSSSN